jgi:hypothetical protein
MKTRLTLRPGQNGTRKLVAKYGARLVAVRYRYDSQRGVRLKTVELVEEEQPWEPEALPGCKPGTLVGIRIGFHEQGLRESIKAAGAIWLPERT